MKTKYFLFLGVSLLISCQTLTTVSVDQLIPAPISFPNEVYDVGIVNNTVVPLEDIKIEENNKVYPRVHSINEDGQLATQELASSLADASYFSRVIINDSILRKNDVQRKSRKLTQEEVVALTDKMAVDVIISIEAQQSLYRLSAVYEENNPYPLCGYNMLAGVIVSVYMPQRKSPLYTFRATDSLFCVQDVWNVSKEIQADMQTFAGKLPVKYLLPTWKKQERLYFAGGSPSLNDARYYVTKEEWEKAYKIWKFHYEHKKNKLQKAKMAFNIALYYEMRGTLVKAESWLMKAQEWLKKSKKETSEKYRCFANYATQLSIRKEQIQKLRLQMQRLEK